MVKKTSILLATAVLACLLMACSDGSDRILQDGGTLNENVLVFTDQEFPRGLIQQIIDESEQDPSLRLSGEILGIPITIVKLSGKTNHFGRYLDTLEYIPYDATVPDTKIYIAEYPYTRDLDLATDETGWWTMYIIKDTGVDLEFSFVFEKEDWITTKTNVNTIVDKDNLDYAIQFIEPDFFTFAMVPLVEGMMQENGYPNFFFENAMVVTVGKSWASMHDDRLPHGDPGATMTIGPPSIDYIGPVYFNEDVIPDVNQPDTSVDGGVTWLNMPLNNIYFVSAEKEGVSYPTVKFNITEADVENGVQLFIASPPDSLEGTNDSPPGEP